VEHGRFVSVTVPYAAAIVVGYLCLICLLNQSLPISKVHLTGCAVILEGSHTTWANSSAEEKAISMSDS